MSVFLCVTRKRIRDFFNSSVIYYKNISVNFVNEQEEKIQTH